MRLAILITIIEVFVTWASYGQTRFSVTGHIQDTASLPLKAVSIILLQVKDSMAVKTAMSDTSGSFSIDILLPGSYFIKISHVGFEEYNSAVFNIDNDRPVEVIKRITLRPASATLAGVTVSGKKKFIERQLDKTVVNVENSIIASTTTALELLQKIPGVTVDQNGNISLNGRSDVLVTINDRKNNLSVQQLAEMLRSISGDNIARIELVTNPSSKYDAQGSGGIINIKMKRSQKKGVNAVLNQRYGQGTYTRAGTGWNISYADSIIRFYNDVDYGYRKSFNNFSNERYFHGVNEQGALFGVSDKVVERNALKVSLGFDYLVGNRSTVSVLWDAFTNNGQSFQQGETIAQNRNMVTDSIVRNVIADKIKFRNYAYGLGYKLLTDTNGGELNIKADYTRFSDGTNNQMYFSYLNGTGSNLHDPLLYNSQESSAIDIFSFNSDYAGRLNKSLKLEAGAKLSWVTTNARMLFNRIIDEREEPDPLFTNHFIYKERIQAAYASLNREFKTTTVQLGVRAERTSSTGNSTTKNLLVDTTYINFFPSFFVLQKMSGSMDVRFNYSRRINRPVYSDLNSFLYFGDPYTYFQGNPFLKPQYSNSYELTFTYKGNYNLSLNYLGTKGVISSVLMAYPNLPGATIGYRTNLGRQSLYTANVSGVTNISNWWSITNSLQLIVNRFKGNYDGNTVDNKKVSVSFNNNQEFSFSSRFKGQLSFVYNSPTVYSIYTFKSLYLLGAGMRISFLKDKLNVKLGIDDIFRSYQQTYSTANADFNMKEVYTTDSRRISVALTYQLSKGKSQVSNKSTGSREESQRARSKNAN